MHDFFKDKTLELTLSQSNGVIISNKPAKLSLSEVSETHPQTLSPEKVGSFGLFGGGEPDYAKYYPNLKQDDWTPKDEDFIFPVYRLFSEIIVEKYGVPIDFTSGVVQESIGMINGRTVNPDHEFQSIGNGLGLVLESQWQEAYKVGDIKIPAGIIGTLKLDAKANPRIARGILSDPPWINSTSVSVKFEWEKSHPDLEDFWEKVGSYDKEGNLIRLVVSKIVNYVELSLVYLGADPFAQKVNNNGMIIDPKRAKSYYRFSIEDDAPLNCSIDFSTDKCQTNSCINKKQKQMDLIKLINEKFKTNFKTEEEVLNFIQAGVTNSKAAEKVTELETQLEGLKKDPTQGGIYVLKSEVEDKLTLADKAIEKFGQQESWDGLASLAAFGKESRDSLITETLSFYALVMEKETDAEATAQFEQTLKDGSIEEVSNQHKTFKSLMEKQVPLTCQSCGSNDVSRKTYQISNETPKDTSYKSLRDSAGRLHRRKPSDIHK